MFIMSLNGEILDENILLDVLFNELKMGVESGDSRLDLGFGDSSWTSFWDSLLIVGVKSDWYPNVNVHSVQQ